MIRPGPLMFQDERKRPRDVAVHGGMLPTFLQVRTTQAKFADA